MPKLMKAARTKASVTPSSIGEPAGDAGEHAIGPATVKSNGRRWLTRRMIAARAHNLNRGQP